MNRIPLGFVILAITELLRLPSFIPGGNFQDNEDWHWALDPIMLLVANNNANRMFMIQEDG